MSTDEFAPALDDGTTEYAEVSAPPCRDCGPGYRIGGDGCRHGDTYQPELGETGICRTCALPIWWEAGEIGGRERLGWSDRIKRGGDSVVCFKAVGYRHVPMGGREAAIYAAGFKAGQAGAAEARRYAEMMRDSISVDRAEMAKDILEFLDTPGGDS